MNEAPDPLPPRPEPEEDLVDPDPEGHDHPEEHESLTPPQRRQKSPVDPDRPRELDGDPGGQERDDQPFPQEVAPESPGHASVAPAPECRAHAGRDPGDERETDGAVVPEGRDESRGDPQEHQDHQQVEESQAHGRGKAQGQRAQQGDRNSRGQGQEDRGEIDPPALGESPLEEAVGHETRGGKLENRDQDQGEGEGEGHEGAEEKIVPDPGEDPQTRVAHDEKADRREKPGTCGDDRRQEKARRKGREVLPGRKLAENESDPGHQSAPSR